MPRGGPRPGFGGKQPGAGRPRKQPIVDEQPPRQPVEGGREFALWALNAPDDQVGMDQKVRLALGLIAAESKQPAAKEKPAVQADDDADVYAPRKVRGYGVVDGGRK